MNPTKGFVYSFQPALLNRIMNNFTKIVSMFFLFLSASVIASEDQGGRLNLVDEEGRKQGQWVYFGKDRPSAGYPEDGKIEEGPYLNDRKEGVWTKYFNDGVTPKLKGEYHNSRPHGAFVKYYADGTVKETGNFVRNKYQDSLKRYHENGKLSYEAAFNDIGNESGNVKYFYPNGQVEYEYVAVDGVQSGKAVRYHENGDVKEIINYSSDGSVDSSEQHEMVNPEVIVEDPGVSKEQAPQVSVLRTKGQEFKANGYNKLYNENDEIWQDGDFKSGRLWSGKVYVYDEDGILLKVRIFREGVYHSDGVL